MNAASASVSMRRGDEYGVSVTSERETTRRSVTVYALERRMPCRSSVSSEKMRCDVVVPTSIPTVRSCGLTAGVEVLVPPPSGRHKERAGLPLHLGPRVGGRVGVAGP